MKVITLLNEKGGVGKTFLATHIAAGLALKGYRVMLMDADPQGSATVSLGLEKEAGLLNLLVNDWDFSDVLRTPKPENYGILGAEDKVTGKLYVLPSHVGTRAIPSAIEDVTLLAHRLEEIEKEIDVVVVDTSPTPSLLHSSIYLASDGIIYPTECEFLSLDGLAASVARRANFDPMRLQINRTPIEIIGVIPNKYEHQTVLHNEHLKILLKHFGRLVWMPVPKYTSFREASAARRCIWSLAPDSKASGQAWKVVTRVAEKVEAWQSA